MRALRVQFRRSLGVSVYATALLAGAARVASGGMAAVRPAPEDGPIHAPGCNPASCALSQPTAVERRALIAEADRLLNRYVADTTVRGRQCYALGATMKTHINDIRMLPYMWRATDADGNVGPVTGDAHSVEVIAGTGTVHIARGYDVLNPDRGLPAILQTARHEFAHLNGSRQRAAEFDAAEQLALACGPS